MASPVYKMGFIFFAGGVSLGSRSEGAPSASFNLYTISEHFHKVNVRKFLPLDLCRKNGQPLTL